MTLLSPLCRSLASSVLGPLNGGALPWDNIQQAAWTPLADPDLVALWLALDATDNGTTLTVPDRGPNGLSLTATGGSGRPSISNTGLANRKAIDFSSLAAGWVPLSSAGIGARLSARTAVTVLFLVGPGAAAASSFLMLYGTTAAGDMRWLYTQPSNGQHTASLYNGAGVHSVSQTTVNADKPAFETVWALTIDCSAGTHKISQVSVDSSALPGTWTADGGPSAMASRAMYIGANSTGAAPFKQMWGGGAVVRRVLSATEIARWGAWMRGQYSMAGTPRRVLHSGDSIVAAAATGWRKRVWDLYAADCLSGATAYGKYQPTGNTGLGAGWAQDYSSAVSGSRILDCQTRLTTTDLVSGTAFRLPDVVSLHAGINDIILDGASAATVAASWTTFLVACYDVAPTVSYKVVSMINNTGAAATVQAANALGPSAVADAIALRPALRAGWVDSIYTVPLSDGTHPTTGGGGGYEQMGDAYYPLIMSW